MDREDTALTGKQAALIVLGLALLAGVVIGWVQYQQVRGDYDAYRALIQRGVTIAGVDVGWLSPEEAKAKIKEWVADPYYEDFALTYQDERTTLSPADDLDLRIPVDEMVAEAVAASHSYDYWEGFKQWIQGEAIPLEFEIPFRLTFDESAAVKALGRIAQTYDQKATEPMMDIEGLAFLPGRPGHRLDVNAAARLINERAPHPGQRTVDLPVETVPPDQSPARIESMLSTLVPVMERPPTAPSYFTATLPLSTTGGIAGTPTVSYTGELTWTFPHFGAYTGPLTTTTGFFFDPGKPGYRFDLESAIERVEKALAAGATEPITFEPELVAPPPITPSLLIPPLKARLAEFPGVTSILVKDLDSNQVIYESNVDYVLSGMSLVKIGIMVEVYRYYKGEIDEETRQELTDMLGSESCNPCANRLMEAVGGTASAGAGRVTDTMRRLGLANFYLCAPFRIVDAGSGENAWARAAASGLWFVQNPTPRYDRCVRATPREMANLVEMIHACTQGEGLLPDAYPNVFSPSVCGEMIDIMAANDLRNMLGAGIPDEVKLAHKHGFSGYDVPWGDTRAEVGIVYGAETTYLVSFYIWQDTPWINWGINQPLYRDVSNMLYNYFNPGHAFWPLPQWVPVPEEENPETDA